MRRATSTSAKRERRDAILAAAGSGFDRLGYADVSIDSLAARAGIAKGTVYLYFPTKESIFLALYLQEQDAWFAQVEKGITGLAPNDSSGFAGLVTDTLAAFPRLPPLAAILHTILERNVREEDALAFNRQMSARFAAVGERLEARLEFLVPGDGVRLLLRVHALIIGCWQAAAPAGVTRRVLQRDEFATFRSEFSEEFENVLVLLLEGWRHSGGGF